MPTVCMCVMESIATQGSESKLNVSHTSNFFIIKNFNFFVKIELFLLVDLNKGEELLSM